MFFNFKGGSSIKYRPKQKSEREIKDEYLGRCVAEQVPPTLSGLAHALGFSSLKEFRNSCDDRVEYQEWVLQIQQHYEENLTKQNGNSSGAQFALSAMFGWKDEKYLNVNNATESIIEELSTEDLRKIAEW